MTKAEEVGPALTKLIETTYTEGSTEMHEVKMVGTGEYLDEDDLKERYKNKPLRFAAIMKNANRFYCKVSEAMLFEDMKSASMETKGVKRTFERTASASNEETIKKVTAKREKRTKRNARRSRDEAAEAAR